MDKWQEATPPAHLYLEGGGEVAHVQGARVFNFYDHKAGHIERPATYPQAPTMPVHDRDGGAAWWVDVRHDDGTSALLDQSRMCTIDYARARGWLRGDMCAECGADVTGRELVGPWHAEACSLHPDNVVGP